MIPRSASLYPDNFLTGFHLDVHTMPRVVVLDGPDPRNVTLEAGIAADLPYFWLGREAADVWMETLFAPRL